MSNFQTVATSKCILLTLNSLLSSPLAIEHSLKCESNLDATLNVPRADYHEGDRKAREKHSYQKKCLATPWIRQCSNQRSTKKREYPLKNRKREKISKLGATSYLDAKDDAIHQKRVIGKGLVQHLQTEHPSEMAVDHRKKNLGQTQCTRKQCSDYLKLWCGKAAQNTQPLEQPR